MCRQLLVCIFLCTIVIKASGQKLGIGTDHPDATLDVHGTFMLQEGVPVYGISADTLLQPGSDSLLPTQSAVMRFLQSGKWAPREGITDSIYEISKSSLPMGWIKDIEERDGIAYVLNGFGLWTFDITQPDTLVMLDSIAAGLFANPAFNMHLRVQGDFAYATSRSNNWLAIFDISNPDSLFLRSYTSQNLLGPEGLAVDSNLAYVGSYYDGNLVVFDISNPDSIIPDRVWTHHTLSNPIHVEKTGRWLWVTTAYSAYFLNHCDVFRFDVSNPDTLIEKGHFVHSLGIASATSSGNRFYVGFNNSYGNYFEGFEVNQNNQFLQFTPLVYVPYLRELEAKGSDLYVSTYTRNPYGSADAQPIVLNFNITTLEPELTWIAPGVVGKICAIDHARFLSALVELELYELEDSRENLDLIRNADGTMTFRNSPWYADSMQNVIAEYGYVGIGMDNPDVNLHLNGDQRIDGNHTIEFGGDIPGKDVNGAKIGNAFLSADALDITGAGYLGLRGIGLWGESGIDFEGTVRVDGWSSHNSVLAEMGMHFSGRVGFGVLPNENQKLLIDDAIQMDMHGSTRPGIFFNRPDNVSDHGTFIGHRDDQSVGIKTQAGWSLVQNNVSRHYGMGMEPGDQMLSVNGNCKTDYLTAHVIQSNGNVRIAGNHLFYILNFAQPQIGYETFTPGALDILGFGSIETRSLILDAPSGTTVDGNVAVAGELDADTLYTEQWSDLSGGLLNGWVNFGGGYASISMYKDLTGVVHLRGLIANGLNQQNTVILNLPAGYRPVDGHQIYAVPNGVNTAGRIDVESDGDVIFRGVNNTFISLDGITFKTN